MSDVWRIRVCPLSSEGKVLDLAYILAEAAPANSLPSTQEEDDDGGILWMNSKITTCQRC